MPSRAVPFFPAVAFCVVTILSLTPTARAWDEDGHAVVTLLAHDKLPADMPDWLRTPKIRARLVYLSAEPDRWRGQHNLELDHINKPDHYLDVESLADFDLTLKALPQLRRRYTDHLEDCRVKRPKPEYSEYGTGRDRDYVRATPGLLPYRIAEIQWTIAASWTQLKTYEAHADRVSPATIENAKENIVYHMGILSHFVGDGSQPLHLTHHHNGWVGENPNGYTTDKGFHAFIDDGVLRLHRISYDDVIDRAKPARKVSTDAYWADILAYLQESHDLVEPLYKLDKSGDLRKEKGKAFVEDRLIESGAMLAGVWEAAYRGAHIDEFRVKRLEERYPKTPGRSGAKQTAAKEQDDAPKTN
ncbi:MAG: hypothetical protein KDA33_03970 [Phycisphaerales bacterium]|nr:hypothetical protein [Phycisphaerales bacterium]